MQHSIEIFRNSGRTKISYVKETSILNFYCAKRVLRRGEDEDCTCDGISDKTLPGILSLKREFKLKQDGVTPSSWIRNSRSMLLLWYSPTGRGGFLNGFHRRGDTTPLKFPASDGCRLHGYTGGKLLQRYTRYRITNNVEYLWRRFSFISKNRSTWKLFSQERERES